MIINNDYDVISNAELNSMLNELPFSLMKENIEQQIVDRLFNSPNYISVILDKCYLLRESFESNEEIVSFIEESMKEFTDYILSLFRKEMDISIDTDELTVTKSVILTTSIYNLYIIKYRSKMTNFFYNYILENSGKISENYEINKKDVTTISVKKKYGNNKEAISILANLYDIMTDIISEYTDTVEFFKYMTELGDYECSVINNHIEDGTIIEDLMDPLYDGLKNDSENSQFNNVFLEVFMALSQYYERMMV